MHLESPPPRLSKQAPHSPPLPKQAKANLIHVTGRQLTGREIKSSQNFYRDHRTNLDHFHDKVHHLIRRVIVYAGEEMVFSDSDSLRHFGNLVGLFKPKK